MSFKPYTTLIPPQVRWFKDLADFGKGGLITIPGNTNQQYRAWMDQSAANYTRDYFTGFYSNTTYSKTYKFIARDSAGYPLLTPIDSKEFLDTYAADTMLPPSIRTYRQYSYMFPKGVPFTETKTLYFEQDKLDEPNFKGIKPGWDYPVLIKPTDMLVVVDGEVQTISVEDFIKMVSVRNVSYEQKLDLVKKIYDRTDMNAKDKCAAIHEITIIPNVVSPVI